MKDFYIRRPSIDEVRPLSLLSTAAFYETYAEKNTDSDMLHYTRTHFSEERLRNELIDPSVHFIISESKDVMNGYAVIKIHNDETKKAELLRLYVLKDFQKKGTGKALLEEVIRIAKKLDAKMLVLAVWKENENAVDFYKANDFEIIGTTTFDWGTGKKDDDYIMEKKI